VAKTLDEKVSRFLQVMLDACAYAGTGDVLKVQQLLAIAGEHPEGEAAATAGEEGTAWKMLHQSGGCRPPLPGVPAGGLLQLSGAFNLWYGGRSWLTGPPNDCCRLHNCSCCQS
jgi:hypothetical protein